MSELILSPKLVVADADAAIAFYTDVFAGRLRRRYTVAGAVVVAELELPGGGTVQVKDADDTDPGPPAAGGGVVLDLLCEDPDTLVARALDGGAEQVFPVADQPYGARQGRFRDPFGHQWIVGTSVSLSDAEVQAVLDDWSGDA